jgi:hypothetical protein
MCNFENLKKFEPYGGIEVKNLELPKTNEVWVVKFDVNIYELSTAAKIYEDIQNDYPDVPMIGIATGIDMETETIDNMIKYLEQLRDNR